MSSTTSPSTNDLPTTTNNDHPAVTKSQEATSSATAATTTTEIKSVAITTTDSDPSSCLPLPSSSSSLVENCSVAAIATADVAVAAAVQRKAQEWEDRIRIVRRHFEAKGYRVHSGLQFGCEFVLYADDPSRVHSDFCVHVLPEDGSMDWRTLQILVRSMPILHKTLIVAHVVKRKNKEKSGEKIKNDDDDNNNNNNTVETIADKKEENKEGECQYDVHEIAMASEHAPFRHKKVSSTAGGKAAAAAVGSQRKRGGVPYSATNSSSSTADGGKGATTKRLKTEEQ